MKNIEYYEEDILTILKSGEVIALKNGTPTTCMSIECNECDCYTRCNSFLGEWLEKEHIASEEEIRTDEIMKFQAWCKIHNYDSYDWLFEMYLKGTGRRFIKEQ